MCAITTKAKYQSPPRLLDSTRSSNSKRYENVWVSHCFLKCSLFSDRLSNFLSCMCSESVWLTFTCSFSLSCIPSTDHRSAERHSSRAAGFGKRVGQSQEKILRLRAGRPRCTREGWHRGQVSSPRLCVRVRDYMCVCWKWCLLNQQQKNLGRNRWSPMSDEKTSRQQSAARVFMFRTILGA